MNSEDGSSGANDDRNGELLPGIGEVERRWMPEMLSGAVCRPVAGVVALLVAPAGVCGSKSSCTGHFARPKTRSDRSAHQTTSPVNSTSGAAAYPTHGVACGTACAVAVFKGQPHRRWRDRCHPAKKRK